MSNEPQRVHLSDVADARDAEIDDQRYPQLWDQSARYRCACKFKTNSRFRWAWHCFWRPIT